MIRSPFRAALPLALTFALLSTLASCDSATSEPEPPSPLALEVFGSEIVPCAYGVAVGTGGFAYATSSCANTVTRFHRTGAPAPTFVRVDPGPMHVAVSPSGQTIYAAAREGRAVSFIDVTRGTYARVPLPGSRQAYDLIVSADGRRLYVGTDAPRLYVIDPSVPRIVDSAEVGTQSDGLAFSPDGRTLYASSVAEGIVVAIETRSLRETGRYVLGGRPHDIAVSPDGGMLYAANELTGFDLLDLRTGVATSLNVGGGTMGMALRREGDYAYVAQFLPGGTGSSSAPRVVQVVDVRARTVHRSLSVGVDPRGIAIGREGTVYVADLTGRVYILGAVQ